MPSVNPPVQGVHTPEQIKALFESPSAEALNTMLDLFKDTETPRDFLVWSLLASTAALLGRNAALRSGPLMTIRPNLYVILMGPPAVRKNSAIDMIRGLLDKTTLNFGPTDTGGQRHGIMAALTGLTRRPYKRPKVLPDTGFIMPINALSVAPRRANDMFLVAPELGRLLGSGSREMADFMVDLWDGADISYQTKGGETRLKNNLGNLLGGTTPSSFATMLPENAGGHGILSRMIFVYQENKHKEVPLQPLQEEDWHDRRELFARRLRWVDRNRIDFALSPQAREAYVNLYEFVPDVRDPRLEQYRGRRSIMLLKLGMILAALRNSTKVVESDINLGHELLVATEPTMHKALEYFGRNKAQAGRVAILDYVANLGPGQTVTEAELASVASTELNHMEFQAALSQMVASKELGMIGEQYTKGTTRNEIIAARNRRRSRQGKIRKDESDA